MLLREEFWYCWWCRYAIFKLNVHVNNHEIVAKFFHISHNLTLYSKIVHKFTRILTVCSTYELTKQFMEICVNNCSIDLKKNNLYTWLNSVRSSKHECHRSISRLEVNIKMAWPCFLSSRAFCCIKICDLVIMTYLPNVLKATKAKLGFYYVFILLMIHEFLHLDRKVLLLAP